MIPRSERESQLEEINKTLREMESLGFVRRTGEFRSGRPVWAATELGRVWANDWCFYPIPRASAEGRELEPHE